jgi:hypothetical protein
MNVAGDMWERTTVRARGRVLTTFLKGWTKDYIDTKACYANT